MVPRLPVEYPLTTGDVHKSLLLFGTNNNVIVIPLVSIDPVLNSENPEFELVELDLDDELLLELDLEDELLLELDELLLLDELERLE